MSSPAEIYVKGVKKKFEKYYAAWLPNVQYQLGDVGVIKDNFFTQLTSLKSKELSIDFKERPDPSPSPVNFQSESGVEISFKATGQINPNMPNLPKAEAGVAVKFSKLGAFVFNAPICFEPSIEDYVHVEKQIIEAIKEERWDPRWVVIFRLVFTPTATIIVSKSSKSEIEFAAQGDISATSFNLGEANITLNTCYTKNEVLSIPGAKDITPLFQVVQIKRRWPFGSYVSVLKEGYSLRDSPDFITPEMARENPESLYLDLIY